MALTKVRGAGVDFDGQDVVLDADGDTKIAAGTDDVITVSTAGTERVRVLSGGGLDLSAGNLVLDNGYGIDFSATVNSSGSVTHEILDDYEIGTFTPAFGEGVTATGYADQKGLYTKVGRLVTFQIELDATNGTVSTNSGGVRITGLPFNTSSSGARGGAWFTFNNNFYNVDAGPTAQINTNDTEIRLYRSSGHTLLGNSTGLNSQNDVHLMGFYFT